MRLWNFGNIFQPTTPSIGAQEEIFYDAQEEASQGLEGISVEEDRKVDKEHLAIERLDRAITHYEESMELQSKSFTAFIELLRWQSARFLLLQTGAILKDIGKYKNDSKIGFLSNLSATCTYGGNALGFFLQLFASFKDLIQWNKLEKQIEQLQRAPSPYVREVEQDERALKEALTKQIASFIRSNPDFLKKHLKDSSFKKNLDNVDEYKTLLELLLNSQTDSKAQKKKIKEIVGQSVHAEDKAVKLLLHHVLEMSTEWKHLEQALIEGQADQKNIEFLVNINELQTRFQKAVEKRLQLEKEPLVPFVDGKAIVERTTKALREFATDKEGQNLLQQLLKVSDASELTEDEVARLLLEKGEAIKTLAKTVQNTYLKKLMRFVHVDVDRFRQIDKSNQLMNQTLERQEQKAQEAIECIQAKIELVLQVKNIKRLLSAEKTDEEKLQIIYKILPSVSKTFPEPIENYLLSESSFNKILNYYGVGFSLHDLSLKTGHDLRISQERLSYLEYVLDVPIAKTINFDRASLEETNKFSQDVAIMAFKHRTTLEQSVKSALLALSKQKLDYLKEVEGGGPLTKSGTRLTKSIYLLSSLLTLISIPLVASGVFTIPGIAILLLASTLQALAFTSLGGGIAYWTWHCPKTFLQHIRNAAQMATKIKPLALDIFRKMRLKDPLHPSESDLANKRLEVLVYEREKLALQWQKKQPDFQTFSNEKMGEIESALQKTEKSVENARRELSKLEALYLQENPDTLPKLNKKRLQDMVDPGFQLGAYHIAPKRLKNYHFTPMTLVFPSLFPQKKENEEQSFSQMRLSLSEGLSSLFMTGGISKELELILDKMGISFKDIKVQIEEKLYGIDSISQEYKLDYEAKRDLKEEIGKEIERSLGLFFGGSLDDVVAVSHLSMRETYREVHLIAKPWYKEALGKIKRISSKWLHE